MLLNCTKYWEYLIIQEIIQDVKNVNFTVFTRIITFDTTADGDNKAQSVG
jgi:hypothetical protein